ncbi:MAG: hypothetical protein ACD_52C00147G0001 [uncultured bacterium]|nr:MAG: hypothetical protein ACD_52C00147G0001 [uncultured bacterium]
MPFKGRSLTSKIGAAFYEAIRPIGIGRNEPFRVSDPDNGGARTQDASIYRCHAGSACRVIGQTFPFVELIFMSGRNRVNNC